MEAILIITGVARWSKPAMATGHVGYVVKTSCGNDEMLKGSCNHHRRGGLGWDRIPENVVSPGY